MPKISRHFNLGKSQAELDFVDVEIVRDTPLFIDPFAISLRQDRWGGEAHTIITTFFQSVIDAIRANDLARARNLLRNLREPNETRLGLSRERPQGAGIGAMQSEQLLEALRQSQAVQTGFLNSLEECELLIPGIGSDKISDLATNVIREHLASYTKAQCDLLGVPMRQCAIGPHFDLISCSWQNRYFELPVAGGRPLLLVPKSIARFQPSYDHRTYYRKYAIEFLRAEHLNAKSALVHTFKNGNQTVFIKDLAQLHPLTKEYLFDFSRRHPEVLAEYKDDLARLEREGVSTAIDPADEEVVARALIDVLPTIAPGNASASEYHNYMIGALEFVLFPLLVCPRKEAEIHSGRKRIDILMENAAPTGIFQRLHAVRNLPCSFIPIECKNYSRDIANPELDQISGRFSTNRGRLGIVCCRSFDDREHFIARCVDTFRDGRGLVIAIDDPTLIELLTLIRDGHRREIDGRLSQLVDRVWLA